MKMINKVNRTVSLFEEQNYVLENWRYEYKVKSCSKIVRFLIDYYIQHPNKLKGLIEEGKKNEGK